MERQDERTSRNAIQTPRAPARSDFITFSQNLHLVRAIAGAGRTGDSSRVLPPALRQAGKAPRASTGADPWKLRAKAG